MQSESDVTRLQAEKAATADGEADAAVAAAFSELDDAVRVHAQARSEGHELQRSVAWRKSGVGGRCAANVGVGTGHSRLQQLPREEDRHGLRKRLPQEQQVRGQAQGAEFAAQLHVGYYATPAMAALALARALDSDDAKAVLGAPTKEERAALAGAFQTKMRLAREQHRDVRRRPSRSTRSTVPRTLKPPR